MKIGGLLYVGENRELQLKECTGCSNSKGKIEGLQNLGNYSDAEGLQFVGSWHTHPSGGNYATNQPSGNWGRNTGGDLWAFDGMSLNSNKATYRLSGGLGLIASHKGLTVYQRAGTIINIHKPSPQIKMGSGYHEGTDGFYFSRGTYYDPLERHPSGRPVYGASVYKFIRW